MFVPKVCTRASFVSSPHCEMYDLYFHQIMAMFRCASIQLHICSCAFKLCLKLFRVIYTHPCSFCFVTFIILSSFNKFIEMIRLSRRCILFWDFPYVYKYVQRSRSRYFFFWYSCLRECTF